MIARSILLFCFSVLCVVTRAQDSAAFHFLEISVVDEVGNPLDDATIDVTMDDAEFPLTVSKEGIATLNLPNESTYLVMKANAPNRIPLEVRWQQTTVPAKFSFTLSKGQTIGGIVHDERGKPIEGVTVEGLVASSRVADEGEVCPVIGGELGKTDAQGIWRAETATLEPLEMRLKLSHEKYFSDVGYGKRRLDNEQIRDLKHVEVLEDKLAPQGVVKTADGKGVDKATLYVVKTDEKVSFENGVVVSNATATAVTDKDGAYVIPNQNGEYRVLCIADEGWSLIPGKRYEKNKPVDILLTPWARVKGVLTEAGEPIANEELQLLVFDQERLSGELPVDWISSARTNDKGEFVFERLTNGYATMGKQLEYCADSDHKTQSYSNEAHASLAPGVTSQVEIKREGLTVSGTVVPIFYDGSEALITCGMIQLEREDEPVDMVKNIFFEWGRSTTIGMNFDPVENAAWLRKLPKSSYMAKLEEDGSFNLQYVPPGKYKANVKLWVEETDELSAGWLEGEIWEPLAVTPKENDKSVDLGLMEIEVYEADE
jgi:hypothetical protein